MRNPGDSRERSISKLGYLLRNAVGVRAILGSDLTPLAIKALLVHAADSATHDKLEVGWGKVPEDLMEVITCPTGVARVVYQGELKPGKFLRATLAVVTHASRQVLSDAVGLANIVDNTLRGKVASRLENQILNGPGGAGRIDGLLSLAAVHVPTATTPGDRIGEAVAGLAADGYKPNLIVLHPNDWFSITAERGGDQHYVLGLPTTPMRPTMWGCNVITTASIPEGRALVMDTTFATVLDRQKIGVAMSESHDRHFTRNLVAIRCELRAGLEFGDLDSAWQFDLTDASSS